MKRTKEHESNFKLFTPENLHDLEEIGEILQTSECSVIVNLSKSKCPKSAIDKAMQFLESYNTSYMLIRAKKVFTRVFIVTSKRNQLI